MNITFNVNPNLSPSTNLFLFGAFIREEISIAEDIEITIPKQIYVSLSKIEFNQGFSDFLIEGGFHESNITIKIQDLNYFQLSLGKLS